MPLQRGALWALGMGATPMGHTEGQVTKEAAATTGAFHFITGQADETALPRSHALERGLNEPLVGSGT